MFMDQKTQYCLNVNFPQLMFRFDTVPIRMLPDFCVEIDTFIP